MNIHLLEVFIAIVENGGVAKASEAMFVSQPAVSKMLRQLESKYECELFDRNGKMLVLNDNGKLLYQQAKKVLDSIQELDHVMNRHVKSKSYAQNYRILTDQIHLAKIIVPYFIKNYMDIHVSMDVGSVNDYEKQLLDGKADIAIAYARPKSNEFDSYFLFQEQIYISCPISMDISRKRVLTVEDMAKVPFAKIKERENRWVTQVLNKTGIDYNYIFEVTVEQLHTLKYSNDFIYCTTYSARLVTPHPQNRVTIPLKHENARRPVYLVWLKKNHAKVDVLLESVKMYYKEMFPRL